jgi:hypothetical protein
MPIYKGSTEVSSGNLHKGSSNIEEGYKGTNQFYVNTLAVTSISFNGANLSNSSQNAIVNISENVSWASITGGSPQTIPAGGTLTVQMAVQANGNNSAARSGTLTITPGAGTVFAGPADPYTASFNQAAGAVVPIISVSVSSVTSATISVNSGTVANISWSANNLGGNTTSGSFGPSDSRTSAGISLNPSAYPACQVTDTASVSASKSGYQSGSGSTSYTGPYPTITASFDFSQTANCNCNQTSTYCPTTLTPNSSCIGNPNVTATNCAGTTFPSTTNTVSTMINATYYELATYSGAQQVGSSSTYLLPVYPNGGCSAVCFYFCSNGPDGTGTGPYAGC